MNDNKDFFRRNSTYRVGTVRDTFQNIKDQIDDLVNQKKIEVGYRQGTPLVDKAFHTFDIFPTDGSTPFSIYDYKFQDDPGENVDTEYNFSLGGTEEGSLESAYNLFDNVFGEINYELKNSLEEMYMTKWKQFLNEESDLDKVMSQAFFKLQDEPKELLSLYKDSLANDIRLKGRDAYADYSIEDFIEDYENYIADKMDY